MKNKTLLLLIIFSLFLYPIIAQNYSWLYPQNIEKVISQSFGGIENEGLFHNAIDIYAPYNTDVYAIYSGIVTEIEPPPSIPSTYHAVTISSEEGEHIRYNHLGPINVEEYDTVQAGITKIGYVSDDCHIHLSFIKEYRATLGIRYNPLLNTGFYSFIQALDSQRKPKFGAFYVKNIEKQEYEKNYIYGSVEIIREARDNMGDWEEEQVGDTNVFSGDTLIYIDESAIPYKITFSILNTSYNTRVQEYKTAYEYFDNIRLVDFNKPAENGEFYFCRILTNSFLPCQTNTTGYIFEEHPWQTRLKSGTENEEALVNWNAEFPDTSYTLRMTAEDVAGNSTTEDIVVPVDNYTPLIRGLLLESVDKKSILYNYSWDINQNNMLEAIGESSILPIGSDVRATITFSEPVTEFTFNIPDLDVSEEFTYTSPVLEQIVNFTVNFPAKNDENLFAIQMTCTDLSGNTNYGFSDLNDTYQPAYRTGNNPNDWNISSFQGVDTCHVLQIGAGNIEVPSASFPTIQSAIDYVWDNNLQDVTVNVQPGTYNENINFRGLTNFSLIGDEQNPASTIIDKDYNSLESVSMNLFPNPTTGKFEISFDTGQDITGQIDLYNNMGQKIKTLVSNSNIEANSQLNFEFSDLTPGIYLVKLTGNNYYAENILVIE